MGLFRFWLTLGVLIGVIAVASLATSPERLTAADPNGQQSAPGNRSASETVIASPTPAMVGVMGVSQYGSRAAPAVAQATVCPSSSPRYGFDVSYYQGSAGGYTINWSQVALSGRTFGYARAADGLDFNDPDFQANYAGMKSVGIKAGAYLFFEPDEDPTAQANVLVAALRQARFAPLDLAPVIDVEVTDGQSAATIAANLQTTIGVVQQQLGVTPVIYTSWGFWNYSVNSTAFSAEPLWTANWGVTCPGVPNGWSTWVVWQTNDNYTMQGITPLVDGDESFNGWPPLYTPPPPRAFLPFVSR